jgi:Zn-dependent protease
VAIDLQLNFADMLQTGSVKVLTLRGVELRFHFSLIFLMFYIVFVTSLQFPSIVNEAQINPGLLVWNPWQWGLVFGLGLLVSIGLHEYGHVFIAQSLGVRPKSVTLMLLGGVSEIEKIPEGQKYGEFKLAIVGPAVSFVLAGIFYLIQNKTALPNLYLFSYWMSSLNLVLGIFNLIPAFPLDGGRALRSVLEARQGRVRATELATQISQIIAGVLGILGLLSLHFLLVLIALVIYVAARNEATVLKAQALVKGMTVGEFTSRVDPLGDSSSLRDVAIFMIKTRNDVIPIQTRQGSGAATISLADIKRIPEALWESTSVVDMMHPVVKSLEVDHMMSSNLSDLVASPQQALPVEESGKIIGLVKKVHFEEFLQIQSLKQSISSKKGGHIDPGQAA